jgi:hypothetical protein
LKPAQGNSSVRPYLEKPFTKIGLVEWLKVKALSSRPVPQKKCGVVWGGEQGGSGYLEGFSIRQPWCFLTVGKLPLWGSVFHL